MDTTNIYLMHDPITGFYKIGRSKSVTERERTLQAQAPQIYVVCSWCECPEAIEKVLHEGFAVVRKRGEWFQLDDNHVRWLFAYMSHWDRVDVVQLAIEGLDALAQLSCWNSRIEVTKIVEKVVERVIERSSGDGIRTQADLRRMAEHIRGLKTRVPESDKWTHGYHEGMILGLVWSTGAEIFS